MERRVIAQGNFCSTTYFVGSGAAEYTIGVKDMGEDECEIVYEDGLYKLIKNGQLVRAATSVLINIED